MQSSTAHSEREWILIGMAESCAAKGFEETTVADICAAAGVSAESFGQVFADKGECLGAAGDGVVRGGGLAADR
jgi:AcrR family transcriptional regulator